MSTITQQIRQTKSLNKALKQTLKQGKKTYKKPKYAGYGALWWVG